MTTLITNITNVLCVCVCVCGGGLLDTMNAVVTNAVPDILVTIGFVLWLPLLPKLPVLIVNMQELFFSAEFPILFQLILIS